MNTMQKIEKIDYPTYVMEDAFVIRTEITLLPNN